MAIQSIGRSGGAADFGNAIGGGLTSGLHNLIDRKMHDMQTEKAHRDIRSAFPELPEGTVGYISSLPPKEQMQALQSYYQGQQGQQQPSALESLQQQSLPQQNGQAQQEPEFGLDQVTEEELEGLKQYLQMPEAKELLRPEEYERVSKFVNERGKPSKVSAPQEALQNAPEEPKKIGLGQALGKNPSNAKEARLQKQAVLDQKKFEAAQTKEARAEGKELRDKKKAAKDTIEDINRLEELEKEGLAGAGAVEFYKNAGLDIPSLIGAPSEEYNKIAANFVRNAKSMFGSRLTDADLNQFLKTVPSLSNSPEGRKRINSNLKKIARLDIEYADTYRDIVKSNKGTIPFDLEEQLDDKMDKKREVIYQQFKKDLHKPVPKGESAILTGILASVGGALGAPGKILGKIGGAVGHVLGG